MAMKVGTRVVRGPDWKWSDQDDGEGHLGTVVTIGKGVSNPAHSKIVVVCWDMGKVADYRAGFDEKYDLLIYDNAGAGIKHNGVTCDECGENDVVGMRWKCSSCYDYDLCNKCYMTSKHDLKHSFLRIIVPKTAGKLMSPRAACRKTNAKGLFTGAKVCRGRDWQWQQQDGGSGNTGVVIREASWANIQRSAIAVRWDAGGAYEYRLGHDGKVDIKCVKASSSGYAYYKDHLPKFGELNSLEIGDRVVVKLDKDVLKSLQENHGGWVSGMEKCIGKVGRLASLTANGDVRIKYPEGETWIINPVAVTKLPSFNTGDKVRVMSDQEIVKGLQKNHGGWNSKMSKALGEEGRVLHIDADGDVKVNVGGSFWTFNPEALILVEQGTGAEGIFEQDIRAGMMAHLLKQLLDPLLDPLGLVDSDDIRQMMTAAAAEAADDGAVTAHSTKDFIKAVMEGDVKRVAEALKKNKGFVNVVVQENTPLHLAAYQGHLQIVELLIKGGAKIDVKDNDGDTALANAVHQDEPRVVKYLLDHRADPNTVNEKGGRSPLHIGTSKNHTQCVRLLLERGCNPNVQDNVGDTPLHDAIRKKQKEITELLINAKNINLEMKNKRGFNPLHHAALTDNSHATRLLIKKQRSLVDIRKEDGYAALHLAVHNNHRNIAEILITEGKCATDLYNEQHQTPLVLAVARGRTPIIEDLIKHGADVNSTDGDGDSCLHLAVMKHRQGQDIPDTDNLRKFRKKYRDNGITKPLTALMCYLVQEGANIGQTNLKKHTPLNYLKEVAVQKVLEHIARKLEREEAGDSSFVKVDAIDGGRERTRPSSSSESSEDQRDRNDPSESLSDDSFCGVHIIKDPKNDVKLQEIIGRGGFGEVWKGQWRGTPVAVKLLTTDGSQDAEVEQEVAIHKRALHPNIVQLMAVGHQRTAGNAMIVMQLIDGSNLMKIIFQEGNPYEFQQKIRLSRDLLSAITYLHHCKILHLDIKPQNVIIETKTKRPYLCDLGLAHIKTRSTMSRASHVPARGTFLYMPPEICTSEQGNMSATAASDVWSLACTLVELFSGQSVWPKTINQMALLCKFMGSDVMPAGVEKLNGDIKKILKPCFQKKPSNRPSAESMMQQFSGLM